MVWTHVGLNLSTYIPSQSTCFPTSPHREASAHRIGCFFTFAKQMFQISLDGGTTKCEDGKNSVLKFSMSHFINRWDTFNGYTVPNLWLVWVICRAANWFAGSVSTHRILLSTKPAFPASITIYHNIPYTFTTDQWIFWYSIVKVVSPCVCVKCFNLLNRVYF